MRYPLKSKIDSLTICIFEFTFSRIIIGFFALSMGVLVLPYKKKRIISLKCICWAGRVTNVYVYEILSAFIIRTFFLRSIDNGAGTVTSESCLNSDFFENTKKLYSIQEGKGEVSLFRDLILLKEKNDDEKGVILIKYTPAFDAFYYYFDLDRILEDFFIILEPSWAGTCDPSFLLFWRKLKQNDVIIQALEPKDYAFISSLGGNLTPIAIGSSDWADQDLFCSQDNIDKEYDLVLVSNWGSHKRHKLLFKSLSRSNMKLSVLLIGFPWGNRTAADIKTEINKYSSANVSYQIKENISALEVSILLNKSKVYLLLSKKEGGNKSIIESFYVNVPAILSKGFVGGVQVYINENTGIFSTDKALEQNIRFMVENYKMFSPRNWIKNNSGSHISTQKINDLLKKLSLNKGQEWNCDIFEKVNSPNLSYKNKVNLGSSLEKLLYKYKR